MKANAQRVGNEGFKHTVSVGKAVCSPGADAACCEPEA